MDALGSKEFEKLVEKSLSSLLNIQATVSDYTAIKPSSRRRLLDAGVIYTVTGTSELAASTIADEIDSVADGAFKESLNADSGSSITKIVSLSTAVTADAAPSSAPIGFLAATGPVFRAGKLHNTQYTIRNTQYTMHNTQYTTLLFIPAPPTHAIC
jgi:hypothetical protein